MSKFLPPPAPVLNACTIIGFGTATPLTRITRGREDQLVALAAGVAARLRVEPARVLVVADDAVDELRVGRRAEVVRGGDLELRAEHHVARAHEGGSAVAPAADRVACVGPVDLVVRARAAGAAAVDAGLGAVLHVVGARAGREPPVPPAPPALPPVAPPPDDPPPPAVPPLPPRAPPVPDPPRRLFRCRRFRRCHRGLSCRPRHPLRRRRHWIRRCRRRSVVPPVPPVLVPPVPPPVPLDPPVPPCPVVPPVPLPPVPGVVVPAVPEQPASAAANRAVVTSPTRRTGCFISDLLIEWGRGHSMHVPSEAPTSRRV